MSDFNLSDSPGIELDAVLAQRLLNEGDGYSQQTADLASFILQTRKQFRDLLEKDGLIQKSQPSAEGFDLAAVDGASAKEARGGGSMVVAAAYKATINDDKQYGNAKVLSLPNGLELDAFATAMRIDLELALLPKDMMKGISADDKLIILDHSFWGVMQAISRALASYKSDYERIRNRGFDPLQDIMIISWQELFKRCLGKQGSFAQMIRNKQVISLSKLAVSSYFVNRLMKSTSVAPEMYRLASIMNDRAILRHILKVGEYTTPQTLYQTTQESSEIKSWKRSRFVTAFEDTELKDPFESRTEVLDNFGVPSDDAPSIELKGKRLFVTYYRPYSWSRVYRIEFHELMLRDSADSQYQFDGQGQRFQKILASIRKSINREALEPLCQVLADQRAKAAVASATSLLPERTFYQLREQYKNSPEMLDVIDTLLGEERT